MPDIAPPTPRTAVFCRAASVLLWLLVPSAASAQSVSPQQFSAVGQADVATTIAAFKAAIGAATSSPSRQITWDDIPDAQAAPNQLPGNVYASQGVMLSTLGYRSLLQVSATTGNPTSTPILFGNQNPAFPSLFTTYSGSRIFRGSNEGGPELDVTFALPGAPPPATATISAFGAVFTDVNNSALSTMEFLDIDGRTLALFNVPAASDHQSVSFLGVIFPTASVARVRIRAGTDVAAYAMPEDALHDIVAFDDFVYSEPQPLASSTITLTTPTASTSYNASSAFLTVAGRASNVLRVDWTNSRGGSGSAFGSSDWSVPNIPIAAGANDLTFTVIPRVGTAAPATTVLHVNGGPFAYYFAEGSTGSFFDTDISIANPNTTAAPVTLTFSREDGQRVVQTDTIAPTSHKTIHVDSIPGLEATALSAIVSSDNRLPLVVERTMFWDQSDYGGKGAAAIDTPSETWMFAEGVQNGFFNTFVLLHNPGDQAAMATLTFERDLGEAPVVLAIPLSPAARVTIDAGTIPDLVGRSFGLSIQASQPIVAERSTYFGTTPAQLWGGGHGSPGVTATAQTWFFAEGSASATRDTFLLLSNPTDQTAYPSVQFEGGSLGPVTFDLGPLPPHGRRTVPVETLTHGPTMPGGPNVYPLANADFVASINSYWPIVAERAMYWVGAPGPWADGTSTFGTTSPYRRWGFAEGRVGGPLEFHTYLRIYAVSSAANVTVSFLKSDGTTIVRTYVVGGPHPALPFVTVDVNAIPGLAGESFATIVESMNGAPIVTERSMYWNAGGVFWAAGITTAGTRLP